MTEISIFLFTYDMQIMSYIYIYQNVYVLIRNALAFWIIVPGIISNLIVKNISIDIVFQAWF